MTTMAYGQATRTWVSGVGDDVNPCSRTAPCKTFAGAISKTAKDGEISVLDPGGFGTITITKSITINGTHGQGYGSILAALAPQGVLVNITDVNDVRKAVRLNALHINGASTGTRGVRILAANHVFINDTIIDGFTTHGVDMNLTGTTAQVFLTDTQIRLTNVGVRVTTTAGSALAVMNNVKIENMASHGVEIGTNGFMTVKDSSITRCTGSGIFASGNGQGTFINTLIAHNAAAGVNANGATSSIRLIGNSIIQNGPSILITGGATVASDGQNRLFGNGAGAAPNAAITLQ
ncbi:MAG TPA: right-handed parallel beta-helix repeat-containing protein [Thermoanaerobaculia bacterium]|nr:right-handed parallel beta-helix repeat-containing protein [Thermoanaerobaculia bacterium]